MNSWCPPDTQHLGERKDRKGKSAQSWYFHYWCLPTALSCCVSVENFALSEQHLPLHFERQKAGLSLFQEIISYVFINFHTQTQNNSYLPTRTCSQKKESCRIQGIVLNMTPNHQGRKEIEFPLLSSRLCPDLLCSCKPLCNQGFHQQR